MLYTALSVGKHTHLQSWIREPVSHVIPANTKHSANVGIMLALLDQQLSWHALPVPLPSPNVDQLSGVGKKLLWHTVYVGQWVCGDLGLRRSRPGWSRPVRGDLARWSRPVRGDLARWSRPVRGDLARWSRPVSCPRCEHATTSQAPLHVRRSSPEISPGYLARSLIADTSPIPWIQQLTR